MKVLLLGEYSGFYRFLREGLMELGVNVHLAANGDSLCAWKQLDVSDSKLYSDSEISIIRNYISPYKNALKLCDYDVVQVINPVVYPGRINNFLVKKIIDSNGLFCLSAAGDDYVLYSAYKNGVFDYFTYDNDPETDELFGSVGRKSRISADYQKSVIDRADLIIPCSYDYYRAYASFENLKHKMSDIIPLPVNCDTIEYKDNTVKNKVVFMHGVSRPNAKGSDYIIAALNLLKEKYPNDVELIITDKLPFDEYLRVMDSANVIVDQCKAYSYGMNACIAMAKGRIVLSGNHPESYEGNEGSPVIWIKPDVDWIYAELEAVLDSRADISDLSIKNRQFAEKHHNHKIVAQQYLHKWRPNESGN